MTPAHYRHIGGAVVTDHGRLTLAAARALALFYNEEAGLQAPDALRECRRRAHALKAAITAASIWRRAAGWNDPDLADQPNCEFDSPGSDGSRRNRAGVWIGL